MVFSQVVYRNRVTGAQQTEYAQVVKVDLRDQVVLLRDQDGWKYPRPLDLVESIDGKPVA